MLWGLMLQIASADSGLPVLYHLSGQTYTGKQSYSSQLAVGYYHVFRVSDCWFLDSVRAGGCIQISGSQSSVELLRNNAYWQQRSRIRGTPLFECNCYSLRCSRLCLYNSGVANSFTGLTLKSSVAAGQVHSINDTTVVKCPRSIPSGYTVSRTFENLYGNIQIRSLNMSENWLTECS